MFISSSIIGYLHSMNKDNLRMWTFNLSIILIVEIADFSTGSLKTLVIALHCESANDTTPLRSKHSV